MASKSLSRRRTSHSLAGAVILANALPGTFVIKRTSRLAAIDLIQINYIGDGRINLYKGSVICGANQNASAQVPYP